MAVVVSEKQRFPRCSELFCSVLCCWGVGIAFVLWSARHGSQRSLCGICWFFSCAVACFSRLRGWVGGVGVLFPGGFVVVFEWGGHGLVGAGVALVLPSPEGRWCGSVRRF